MVNGVIAWLKIRDLHFCIVQEYQWLADQEWRQDKCVKNVELNTVIRMTEKDHGESVCVDVDWNSASKFFLPTNAPFINHIKC
jgi:hypothetical protein